VSADGSNPVEQNEGTPFEEESNSETVLEADLSAGAEVTTEGGRRLFTKETVTEKS